MSTKIEIGVLLGKNEVHISSILRFDHILDQKFALKISISPGPYETTSVNDAITFCVMERKSQKSERKRVIMLCLIFEWHL